MTERKSIPQTSFTVSNRLAFLDLFCYNVKVATNCHDSESSLLQNGSDFPCGAGDQPGGDGRSATDGCSSALTLALYLIYVCNDPLAFLNELRQALEADTIQAA